MNYEERLKNVTVLGAAGKMGSGILFLTAIEMAELQFRPDNKQQFLLNAVDVSDEALSGVMKYMRTQVFKHAEKRIVALRLLYKDRKNLIDNSEIIDQYINDVLSMIRYTTRVEAAYGSTLIFEAIKEDPQLKADIFRQIAQNNQNEPWFFTNTSSIPITKLDEEAGLKGKILGFHFYNPPAVQKLVEIIKSRNTLPEVEEFALAFAKKLRKTVVNSNDVAGFIGNGHFMRDIIYAGHETEKLLKDFPLPEAIYAINHISQDYLIRPMGIFQLIDYVGIDVCSFIMSVMKPYMKDEDLQSPLLDKMLAQGVKGGQFPDGSQKDGFFKYEKGKPVMVYDPEKKEYLQIESFRTKVREKLGDMPPVRPWKAVVNDPEKDETLRLYFQEVNTFNSLAARLTKDYAKKSKEIGLDLVAKKVANNVEDVNTVLLTGFFHAYGPVNDFIS